MGYKALSQSSHTATVILSKKISPCQLASFTNFRKSSIAWLEIWKMTPLLQHSSLTEFLAFKQYICNVFNSNSLVYQRFTEYLNWASPIVGTGNTAVINRWKSFPSWNIYFREKTYHKQNKEVTYVLCRVMIESKEKQKKEREKGRLREGELGKVTLRKDVREAWSKQSRQRAQLAQRLRGRSTWSWGLDPPVVAKQTH